MRKFLMSVAAVAMMLVPVVGAMPVMAEDNWSGPSCGGVSTNLISCSDSNDNGEAIMEILMLVLNILSGLVLTLAVAGIIISGVQYLTARDNEGQMTKAKSRLFQIVIGLVAYALMWAFLNWIVPGGMFNSTGGEATSSVVDDGQGIA